ncbi:MAG: hypothetical protein NTW72_14360 [Gemmatimonadetes bacterium]|nr:hypothetical protein [Gemmatimonadota bacterium]
MLREDPVDLHERLVQHLHVANSPGAQGGREFLQLSLSFKQARADIFIATATVLIPDVQAGNECRLCGGAWLSGDELLTRLDEIRLGILRAEDGWRCHKKGSERRKH